MHVNTSQLRMKNITKYGTISTFVQIPPIGQISLSFVSYVSACLFQMAL